MYKPKVAIMMSTYNGERFIEQQLDSLVKQQKVCIYIFIRDDGSTDNTIKVIENFKVKRNFRDIYLTKGKNVGYAKSFLNIVKDIPECYDYYFYCDQDDIWDIDKITIATNVLKDTKSVYVSSLRYVDDNLNTIKIREYKDIPTTLPSIFTRMRFAGCTMGFTPEIVHAAKILLNNFQYIYITHDAFILSLCEALGGTIYVDQKPHISYRRSDSSITPGGRNFLNRLRYELKRIHCIDNLDIFSSELIKNNLYCKKYERYLKCCSMYKNKLYNKLLLIKFTIGSSKNAILDIEAILKIIFNTF